MGSDKAEAVRPLQATENHLSHAHDEITSERATVSQTRNSKAGELPSKGQQLQGDLHVSDPFSKDASSSHHAGFPGKVSDGASPKAPDTKPADTPAPPGTSTQPGEGPPPPGSSAPPGDGAKPKTDGQHPPAQSDLAASASKSDAPLPQNGDAPPTAGNDQPSKSKLGPNSLPNGDTPPKAGDKQPSPPPNPEPAPPSARQTKVS